MYGKKLFQTEVNGYIQYLCQQVFFHESCVPIQQALGIKRVKTMANSV
jgi:hypothetical protein